jgi:protein SCO1/2
MWGSVATVASLAVGAACAWVLTAGFTSFTSESWRRADVAAHPRPVPIIELQSQAGTGLRTDSLCDKVLIVDFIYTQCTTICKSLGAISSQLARRLDEQALGAQVLSVSFDPARDTPEKLGAFKRSMEPAATSWQLARPVTKAGRESLLQTFGVVVIPDGYGGFDHNAGLHVVHHCKLVKVLDPEDLEGTIATVRSLIGRGNV